MRKYYDGMALRIHVCVAMRMSSCNINSNSASWRTLGSVLVVLSESYSFKLAVTSAMASAWTTKRSATVTPTALTGPTS